MNDAKKMFQIACIVQQQLKKYRENTAHERLHRFSNFRAEVARLADEIGKYEKALSRKWYLAAKRIKNRITRAIDEVCCTASRSREISHDIGSVPELSMLIEELTQLEQDCGPMAYVANEGVLSAVTDPIELEGITLGQFSIELHLKRLADLCSERPYKCIAFEPNPASADEDTVHPHVNGERLCEGEGSYAIRAALEQGRLTDFFTMVTSILDTYNPDSAYVSLSDWLGTSCWDCGTTVVGDDCYHCFSCENSFCDYCASYCRVCNSTCCLGCGDDCPECGVFVCHNCIKACIECGKECCAECLDEQVCPTCRERKQENEEENANHEIEGIQGRDQVESNDKDIRLAG